MRTMVLGAGALGCYFDARLQDAGHDVTYVARGDHLDAMKANGLRVEIPSGDIRLDRVHTVTAPAEAGPADLVLFAVKNYDVEQAAAELSAVIEPGAVVITVQNGVSAQPHLAERFGRDRVLPGAVYMPTDMKSPGVIRVSAEQTGLTFGAYEGGVTERAQRVFDTLTASGVPASLSEDIWKTLWLKFILMSALAPITAMTRLDIGPIRHNAASRGMLRNLLDEAAAIARAEHPTVPSDAADTTFEFLLKVPPSVHASMLDDLLRGKRLELEWYSGEVIRRGARHGIDTPSHSFAYAVLAPTIDGRPEGSH